jgi:heme-degrading monooxygenase HmoA
MYRGASNVMILLGRTFSGLHCLFDYDCAHEHAHKKILFRHPTACFAQNAECRSVRIADFQLKRLTLMGPLCQHVFKGPDFHQERRRIMIAKILIKRKFKEGNTAQIVALLNEIRTKAMDNPGYLSGETLIKRGYPNTMVIISTWRSLEDWRRWLDSHERNTFEAMLEVYQEGPTEYDEYLLGSPLHKE